MKINGNAIRPGMVIEHQKRLWIATKIQHTQPGKGGAYLQVELKDLLSGSKLNERFRASENIERVRLDQKVHQFLFAEGDMLLVDYKLEFGVFKGEVVLGDEFSPDGCRLWDMVSGEKLDKDRFRRDLGGEVEAYQEVARRLGLLPEGLDTTVLDLDTHRKKREKE